MDNNHQKCSSINGSLPQTRNPRLLLFPISSQGHLNPMIQLANILHSKGFEVSIIHTRFNYPDTSKYPHFTFHQIPDGLSETEASALDPINVTKLLVTDCAEQIREFLTKLLSRERDRKDGGGVVCMVTDELWYFTQSVADDFKIPRIVLRTSSVCSYIVFNMLPLLLERGYVNDMDSKLENAIEELPPLKVKDIPIIDQLLTLDSKLHILINMLESTKKSSGVIFNTFKELEECDLTKLHDKFQHHVPIFTIGPFHKLFSASLSSLRTPDRSSISWLDKQEPKSVLYVSFGSSVMMDEKKLHEMAWGLANSKQPFLWVVRPGLVRGPADDQWLELLPSGFLDSVKERSCIVKWAPQQEVLSHRAVGGFLTHNGWNSTLESICEGVPMICAPFHGDQRVNSRYVCDVWKIGIRLEKGIESDEIVEAVAKLMKGSSEGEEMKKRAMDLKEKADLCLSSSGSSSRAIDGLVDLILSFDLKNSKSSD